MQTIHIRMIWLGLPLSILPPLAFESSSVALEELTTEGVFIDETSARLGSLRAFFWPPAPSMFHLVPEVDLLGLNYLWESEVEREGKTK
ncbi:hypothetical protein F4604DRAFT_1808326, partial [Suillus subluteus]